MQPNNNNLMNFVTDSEIRRRAFLGGTALSLGSIALSSMLGRSALANSFITKEGDEKNFKLPKASAKRVIMIFLSGGLSQLDLFDEKPLLNKRRGEELPDSVRRNQRITGLTEKQGALPVVGSCYKFKKYGKTGMNMAEILPNIGELADDLTLVRSLQTDHVLHEAAMTILFTGTMQLGRPGWGAWTSYALGSENKNIPEFVVLLSGQRGGTPLHPRLWNNGFLPGRYQGVQFRSGTEPVLFVANPPGIDDKARKRVIDSVKELNEIEAAASGDQDVTTRIQAYEMAARMQTSVPELTDFSKEDADTLERYGADTGGKESFANNCLLARRLAERGVRFIQLCDGGWDHHFNIPIVLKRKCEEVDKPVAALITDLKERGLLEDTIVIFTGEFGRTSYCEGPLSFATYGRDHNQLVNSVLLTGGGFKRGFEYGKSDDWGWDVVENGVHVHDLHATVLQQLGLEHTRLTYRYQARDFRLTDVAGKVVNDILA
ncbi:MAG: DUF1501 domain-containing protein [Planctomycetota bacterium]